jgi:predicted transglutaminase-like cysteine proteinase
VTARADVIREINERVNSYPYTPDIEQFNRPDFWQRIGMTRTGDCEDYALEKRAQLLQAGVPPSDIRIALCTVETGGLHAVLVVADPESGGDWILDNRQRAPYTLDEFRGLGYQGVSLQVPGEFMWKEWRT